MTAEKEKAQGQTACAVELSSKVVDAGAEFTLTGTAKCSPIADLRGKPLLIKDQDGAVVASLELVEFDGEINTTNEFTLIAPAKAGEYTWSVVSPEHDERRVSYKETSAPFLITVKAHTTSVVVWDVPFAVAVGERFKLKVGIKCSNQCRLGSLAFGIYDQQGAQVGKGAIGAEIAPGTSGLYFTEIEIDAPESIGNFTWSAKTTAGDFEPEDSEVPLPHAEGSAAFGVSFVNPPDYLVTVEAIDAEKKTPIKGAQVVLDPYRAVTDENGMAKVRVAKGAYKLFVSGPRYYRFGTPLEVTGDVSTRAELLYQPPVERN